MFLRILFLLIIFTVSLSAIANIGGKRSNQSIDLINDIKMLKRILRHKPDDPDTLKSLAKAYFIKEDFKLAHATALKFLLKSADKDVAYINIISLANVNRHKDALKEIDNFLEIYAISNNERKLINYKRKLFSGSMKTKPYPIGGAGFNMGKDKEIISFIDRAMTIFGYDKKKNGFFTFKNGNMAPLRKPPEFLNGLKASDIIFLSCSSDGREALVSLKSGNSSMIIYKQYEVLSKKWSGWKSIGMMNPGAWNCYGNFTSDAGSVLFSSNYDGNNGLDIYITSRMSDGRWSRPQKLSNINTPVDEYSLFLHPDGETIYYSSNGKKGHGGFDIYGGKLIKKKEKYFVSNIRNLESINTFRNEISPLLYDFQSEAGFMYLYLEDKHFIYKFNNISLKPFPVTFFNGYVYDRKTKKPISGADVKIMGDGKRERRGALKKVTHPDGFLGISLTRNSKYIISISAKDYLYYRGKIVVGKGDSHLRKNFYLKKGRVKKGFSFVANNIYFDTGSAKLKEDSYAELQNIFTFLTNNPEVTILISGHTDNVGKYKFNMELSKQRALSIADYINNKGVSIKRLFTKGFGYTKKAFSNETGYGRQKNRRVEITVTDVE